MLYTTYLSKLDSLPENAIKIIISRYKPKGIYVNPKINLFHNTNLAPSETLLKRYKSDKDWEKYCIDFMNEILSNEDAIILLNSIRYAILHGRDVILLCYEKDYLHCHRYILAKYLESYGINWNELLYIS